jgi:hypothetical protein
MSAACGRIGYDPLDSTARADRTRPDVPVDDSGCCAVAVAFDATPSAAMCGGPSDSVAMNFETGTDGWVLSDPTNREIPNSVGVSTARVFAGRGALRVDVDIGSMTSVYARLRSPPAVVPGRSGTFHVWIPPDAELWSIQAYFMDVNYTWSGMWVPLDLAVPGCWNTLTVDIPPTFVGPAFEAGVQFLTAGTPWRGTVYVDSVTW